MKKILISCFISLITGLCFVAGGFIAVSIFDSIESNDSKRQENLYYVRQPENILISEHRTVQNMPYLTVQGMLKNNSELTYYYVNVEMHVFAGDALMNTCDFKVYNINSNSERIFKNECNGVSGTNLPNNINYKLNIKVATLEERPK